jgi:hypothetical protein
MGKKFIGLLVTLAMCALLTACGDSSSSSDTSASTSDDTVCDSGYELVDGECVAEDADDTEYEYQAFIDRDYFDFAYGDTEDGERMIDSQYASTAYFNADPDNSLGSMFGVNFADGRIKGYGLGSEGDEKTFTVMYVRDAIPAEDPLDYGVNDFTDNGDETVTDTATGLMWMQDDSGAYSTDDDADGDNDGMVWEDALAYCEDSVIAGYSDWRLPNAKELQGIVDYTKMPDAVEDYTVPDTAGPVINEDYFNITAIVNANDDEDWGFYWTSSTHKAYSEEGATGGWAAYVAFGRALGYVEDAADDEDSWEDVHGAGCQRSDPKMDNGDDYSTGHGPQGDAISIYNYARCVRDDDSIDTSYIGYPVVDTNQSTYWDTLEEIDAPAEGEAFYGQDAMYAGTQSDYTDNGDGTITDNITGLMWEQLPDRDDDGVMTTSDKLTYDAALAGASAADTGGYDDWRLPTIKELYSLFQLSGEDVSSLISDMPTELPSDEEAIVVE